LIPILTIGIQELRAMVYNHALPSYEEFDANHPRGEVVPITHLKAYLRQFGAVFRVDRETRKDARDYFFEHNNIGAYQSVHAPEDMVAIPVLGWEALQTIHIDLELNDDWPVLGLLAILYNTTRLRHLFLEMFTGLSEQVFPTMWECEDEVEDFRTHQGAQLAANLLKITDIHIDLVCEQTIAAFGPPLGAFLQYAWMNRTFASDSLLTCDIKRALFQARPTIELRAAQDEKTYSNRGLED
jgi:hypothetical protein